MESFHVYDVVPPFIKFSCPCLWVYQRPKCKNSDELSLWIVMACCVSTVVSITRAHVGDRRRALTLCLLGFATRFQQHRCLPLPMILSRVLEYVKNKLHMHTEEELEHVNLFILDSQMLKHR